MILKKGSAGIFQRQRNDGYLFNNSSKKNYCQVFFVATLFTLIIFALCGCVTEGQRQQMWTVEPRFAQISADQSASGYYKVEDPETKLWGLVDERSEWVVEPQYSWLDFSYDRKLLSARHESGTLDKYSLITDGGEIIGEEYSSLAFHYTDDKEMIFAQDVSSKLVGAINSEGDWLIEPTFLAVQENKHDVTYQAVQDSDTGLWGLVDLDGEEVVEPSFEAMCIDQPDGIPAQDATTKLWGFIDEEGNWLVEPRFDHISRFSTGAGYRMNIYAQDPLTHLWGSIDMNGSWVETPRYNQVEAFQMLDNYFVASIFADTTCALFDGDANLIFESTDVCIDYYQDISILDDNAAIKVYNSSSGDAYGVTSITTEETPYGYMNMKTKELIFESVYRWSGSFVNGTAIVMRRDDRYYGVINQEGQWVIQPEYRDIQRDYNHGFFIVKDESGSVGLMDETGSWIVAPEFKEIICDRFNLDHVYTRDSQSNKWGIRSLEDFWVVQPTFAFAPSFNGLSDFAAATEDSEGGKWGLINKTGEWILSPTYASLRIYGETIFAKDEETGLYGIIDKEGTWLVEPYFTSVGTVGAGEEKSTRASRLGYFSASTTKASSPSENAKTGIINASGEWVLDPVYDDLYPLATSEDTLVFRASGSNGRNGLIMVEI